MAYNAEKLTGLAALKSMAAQAKAANDKTEKKVDALVKRVDDLVTAGGEPNVITGVKFNGEALAVGADKSVNIEAATQKDVADAVAAADHLTRKKVASKSAIDPSAEGADKYIYMVPKTGSDEDDLYDEYMVLDGKVEHVGNTKIDLSGYQQKEDGKGLSSNDFTDEEKAKLAGMEVASDAEVAEMLAEVFGTAE